MMGPMEATASAVGDEMTELAGLRATRLTVLLEPETGIQHDVANADGTLGEVATPLAVDFAWSGALVVSTSDTTGVVVGKFLRLDTDGQLFEVASFVVNTSVTLLNPGALVIPTGTGPTSQLVPTVVSLTSGAFVVGVVAGTRWRALGGTLDGISELVNTVDSGTQITLRGPYPSFTATDWEVVQDGATVAQVETTLDWPAVGAVRIDGVLYTYTSKTLSTLEGLQGYDGVQFGIGAQQRHAPLSEVLEFSQTFSALEQLRREVFVETATGDRLSAVGQNLAVQRPPDLADDGEFARLIRATAFAPKGTVWGIELALEALLGETTLQTGAFCSGSSPAPGEPTTLTLNLGTFAAEVAVSITTPDIRFRITRAPKNPDLEGKTIFLKRRLSATQLLLEAAFSEDFENVEWEITKPNWEIFEDFTSASPFEWHNTVFLRRTTTNAEDHNGKTYLDGDELALTTGASTLSLAAPPIRVQGMRLADEPPIRLIHQGAGNASIGASGLVAFRALGDEGFATKGSDPSGPAKTITDLGGFVSQLDDPGATGPRAFVAGDVGKMFYVNGATDPDNNGIFVIASVPLGTRVTYVNTQGPANETSALSWNFSRIAVGDCFEITDGAFAGERATILNINSNVLTLAPASGFLEPGIATEQFSANAALISPQNVSYRITRPISNFRFVYPSSEFYLDAGGAPIQQWTYGDPPNEPAEVVFVQATATDGSYLTLIHPGTGDTAEYTRPLRILPESKATFEFLVSATNPMNAGAAEMMQFAFQIHDGERVITVGYREIVANTGQFQLIDASTGTVVGSGAITLDFTSVEGRWASVRVVKDGRSAVKLYRGNSLVGDAPYTSFPTGSARQLRFGTLHTAALGINPIGFVKQVDWACYTPVELWNAHFEDGATNAGNRQLADGDTLALFQVGVDEGKGVRIKSFGALNPAGGNARGEWEVESVVNVNTVVLTGRRQEGAGFTPVDTQRVTIRGVLDAFVWPDHRGHSVEFLTGPNAGVYPILQILDPVTLADVEQPPFHSAVGGASNLKLVSSLPPTGGTGPAQYCVRVHGLVAGVATASANITVPAGGEAIVPTNFDAASVDAMELVPCSPGVARPVTGALKLLNVSNGLKVLEISDGLFGYGRPSVVAESATWATPDEQQLQYRSNVARLDAAGGAPARPLGFAEDANVPWRLVPTFPVDTALPFELVDAGTVSGATLTARQNLNTLFGLSTGELLTVGRTTVLSAVTLGDGTDVELAPGGSPIPPLDLTHYAFWLFDDFGFIRELARDTLTVAGVISDQDSFLRDDTGPHIIP